MSHSILMDAIVIDRVQITSPKSIKIIGVNNYVSSLYENCRTFPISFKNKVFPVQITHITWGFQYGEAFMWIRFQPTFGK